MGGQRRHVPVHSDVSAVDDLLHLTPAQPESSCMRGGDNTDDRQDRSPLGTSLSAPGEAKDRAAVLLCLGAAPEAMASSRRDASTVRIVSICEINEMLGLRIVCPIIHHRSSAVIANTQASCRAARTFGGVTFKLSSGIFVVMTFTLRTCGTTPQRPDRVKRCCPSSACEGQPAPPEPIAEIRRLLA